ncbi:MAG: protein kinase [Planctomycetota bacterium]
MTLPPPDDTTEPGLRQPPRTLPAMPAPPGGTRPARIEQTIESAGRTVPRPLRTAAFTLGDNKATLDTTARPPVARLLGMALDAPADGDAGRYESRGEIARGGMGVVMRVFDRDVRRDIAMKVMLNEKPSPEAVARFLEEVQITGQLEHPGIVPVHEVGLDGQGRIYYTMKLVRGRALDARLKELRADLAAGRGERRFPLAQRLDVFRKVCDAIAFAHARGVIHRDLKPANIMVGEFGEVQVMDWGIARILENRGAERAPAGTAGRQLPGGANTIVPMPPVASDRRDAGLGKTMDGQVAGTPAFMAPEQARGEIDRLDERTDVYSLGAILYEMLALVPPFGGPNVMAVLDAVKAGDFEPAAQRARSLPHTPPVPPELDAICAKAMTTDPRRRYRDVPALRADIDAWFALEPVAALRESVWRRAIKWARRNPTRAMTAAIGGLALLITGTVVSIAVTETRRSQAEARETAARSESERLAVELSAQEIRTREATLALNTERLAFESERLAFARDRARTTLEFYARVNAAEKRGLNLQRFLHSLDASEIRRYIAELEDLVTRTRAAGQESGDDAFHLGLLYSAGLRDGATGERWFDRALELGKVDEALTWTNRAMARDQQGNVEGALADLGAAIERFPERYEPYMSRSQIRFAINDFGGSLDDARRACELVPNDAGAHNARALALVALGRTAEAMAELNRTLELVPNHTSALTQRSRLMRTGGQLDNALRDSLAATQADPTDPLAWYEHGENLRLFGQAALALEAFNKAIGCDATMARAHRAAGVVLRALERLPEAEAALREAIRLDPAEFIAWMNLGQLQLERGERDAGVESLQTAWKCADDRRKGYIEGILKSVGAEAPR